MGGGKINTKARALFEWIGFDDLLSFSKALRQRKIGMNNNFYDSIGEKDRFIGIWLNPYDNSLKAQVGRGASNDIDLIARDIVDKLEINATDVVLDACCGNGLITRKIARFCKEIHGVDFSNYLIKVASESNENNINYYLEDALNIDKIFYNKFFDKCYCYFSFQHFNYNEGRKLIEILSNVAKPNGLILLGDIPDVRKKWIYYNNFPRKLLYLIKRMRQRFYGHERDPLGWWYHPDSIIEICSNLGIYCEILKQDERLPHAYFRFDVLIKNQ